jgi:hypothetical protein
MLSLMNQQNDLGEERLEFILNAGLIRRIRNPDSYRQWELTKVSNLNKI